eukprot:7853583-Alexandrium_andersonii.AAC.1
MARPAAAAIARAAVAQRGDLRAGAAPLTAPGMAAISLMRPPGAATSLQPLTQPFRAELVD